MLGRLFLSLALFLAKSTNYQATKTFFRNLLENNQKSYKKIFDLLMIFVVLSSIILLIQEVKFKLPYWLIIYNYYIVTAIFLFEYLLRMWIYSDIHKTIIDEHEKASFAHKKLYLLPLLWKIIVTKFNYMRSPSAIIDLLAIFPSYRPLRVLRIFLLFRVIKLLRYTKSIQNFLGVIHSKKFELLTLLLFLAFVTFISGVLIYVFEGNGQNKNIVDFFDALYWALVTISTVGYGDISPVTTEGRIVSIIVIITGVAILAFATSIIVSAFTEKLDELKAERSLLTANRLKSFYLICGYSQMAEIVAEKLRAKKLNVVVIDHDKSRIEAAQQKGYVAIIGDASKLSTYSQISHHSHIKAALVLVSDNVQSTYITLTLRSLSKKTKIYTKADSHSMVQKLKLAGATRILHTSETIGDIAKEYIQKPIAFDAINRLIRNQNQTTFTQLTLFAHDLPVGKTLQEVDFFTLKLILVGLYRDGNFIFNPKKDFIFKERDTLILIGKHNHVIQLNEVLKHPTKGAKVDQP